MNHSPEAQMDAIDAIMLIEGGDADEEQIIEAFQSLIDSGVVWSLQGSYGRAAASLIDQGLCCPAGDN